jgi:osmotically-inducible protein OsmY
MRFSRVLVAVALAAALPAIAQSTSSSSSTSGGVTTTISGGTGTGTVSASGVVVNPQQDQALLQQVTSALRTDPAIAGATIDVQVVGGRVTLNGEARSTAQAEDAREIAQGIAGSANVSSNLTTARQ